MTTFEGRLSASMRGDYSKPIGTQETKFDPNIGLATAFANGVGANEADLMFFDSITLAAAASQELDLHGSLNDPLGDVLNLVRVKAIIVNSTDGAANLVLGGAAANAFLGPFKDATDKLEIRSGGYLMMVAPDATAWPVTPATGDLLRVEHDNSDGADITFEILIIGASA